MRKRRISERDVDAVLSGHAPASRPDLARLAEAVAEFRVAAFESSVGPSTALAERLGLQGGSKIPSRIESQPGGRESRERRRVSMFSWIAGLGLAAKIALGAGVAVAATAGAGAAGVLPSGAQDAFNTVVSTVIPVSHPGSHGEHSTVPGSDEDGTTAPDPTSTTHPDNFGAWVSERAKDPNKVGSTFGHETSQAAKDKGNGNTTSTEKRGDNTGSEASDDAATEGSGNADGHGNSTNTPAKP